LLWSHETNNEGGCERVAGVVLLENVRENEWRREN